MVDPDIDLSLCIICAYLTSRGNYMELEYQNCLDEVAKILAKYRATHVRAVTLTFNDGAWTKEFFKDGGKTWSKFQISAADHFPR